VGPDLKNKVATKCTGKDPKMGCFALDQPKVSKMDSRYKQVQENLPEGEVMWFPSYRVLPALEEYGFNRYVGDIRWRTAFPVQLMVYYSDEKGYTWYDHGKHIMMGATSLTASAVTTVLFGLTLF
jgi:hypothetical protein